MAKLFIENAAGRGFSFMGWVGDPQQALHFPSMEDAERTMQEHKVSGTIKPVPPKPTPGMTATALPMFSAGNRRG